MFFSFLILESWRIPSCWRHLCFVGSTLQQWFAYFILFSFSTSSIMSTRSLWPLKFSFLWCIFFKVSTEFPPLRQYDRWVCAQDSPGDSRARFWPPPRWALVILHSNVTRLSSHICSVFPETCQIQTACVKVQSLKALAVRVQLNRHEKVEDKGVKRSAVHISIISQIQCASCFHLISGVHALLRVDAGNGSLYNHLAPWCWLTSWQRWSRWSRWSGWPGSVG